MPPLFSLALLLAQPGDKAFQPQPFDWPQWQGRARDNRSAETGLRPTWPKDGPPEVWRVKGLGGGYSAPAIAAGRIIGMSYHDDDEVVWARAVDNGRELWKTTIAKANRVVDYKQGSRSTPTVDGDRLYALGVSGDLVCLNVADGKMLWRTNLIKDYGGILPFYRESYGYAESPLIDDDKVVVTPGGTKATVVALHKKDGKPIWAAQVPEGKKGSSRAAYASLVAGEAAGVRQYVQFLQGAVIGVSALQGKLLWTWHTPSNDIANCTTPIFFKDFVFASSGYGKGCGLARIERAGLGKEPALRELWFNKAMKNVHGGLVLVDGHVYGNSDPGLLVCLELETGKVKWQDRSAGRGSLIYADGHIYYRDEKGPMLLVEANPAKYTEKARFDPPDRSTVNAWTHPVLANGRLYLRDQDVLIAYDVKKA